MNIILLIENIKFLMSYKSLTLMDLEKSGVVSKGYLSELINGKKDNVGFKIVAKISKFFNIDSEILTKVKLDERNVVTYVDEYSKNKTYKDSHSNSSLVNDTNERYEIIEARKGEVTEIPLFESSVSAGIPKEVMDYPTMKIAVGPIKKGAFAVKVSGNSMIDFKIDDGDTLVVFPTNELKFGQLVVARCEDAYTVKKLVTKDESIYLVPGNKDYEAILVEDKDRVEIIGYVLYIMKKPYLNGDS